MDDPLVLRQVASSKGCLAGTVRSGDHDAARLSPSPRHSGSIRAAEIRRKFGKPLLITEVRATVDALRAELVSAGSAAPPAVLRVPSAGETVPFTPLEKVRLFRTLFRGRADIFPVRFVSGKMSRPVDLP